MMQPAVSEADTKFCVSSHWDETVKAGEGNALLMFCKEIILYKQSLEIHLCMLSQLLLSEVVSEPIQ